MNARLNITNNYTVTRELTRVADIDPNNDIWIVRLVSSRTIDHPIMFVLDAPAGDFSNSRVVTVSEGGASVTSEITIQYDNMTFILILSLGDSQLITDEIATAFSTMYSVYTDVGDNIVRIEHMNQSEIDPPTITVTTAGTSAVSYTHLTLPTKRIV